MASVVRPVVTAEGHPLKHLSSHTRRYAEISSAHHAGLAATGSLRPERHDLRRQLSRGPVDRVELSGLQITQARREASAQKGEQAEDVIAGGNAAVVGILGAAVYSPVWTSAILNPYDFALALTGFILLVAWKTPSWFVVVVMAAGGILLHLVRPSECALMISLDLLPFCRNRSISPRNA